MRYDSNNYVNHLHYGLKKQGFKSSKMAVCTIFDIFLPYFCAITSIYRKCRYGNHFVTILGV